jgi:hypothetical protein
MALHDNLYVLTKDVQTRLASKAGQTGFGYEARDVFFGDQQRIPRTPALCVEPGGKVRQLQGAPRRTEVTLSVYIIVYHYLVAQASVVREADDQLAETIEAFMHEAQNNQLLDTNSEPTVIDSMVTNVESGWMPKGNSLFRASRLAFEARTQVQLPMNTP